METFRGFRKDSEEYKSIINQKQIQIIKNLIIRPQLQKEDENNDNDDKNIP